ncbi:MAG TPA: ABC transporter permease [Candidatus Limnocylindrales bacterium]
MPRWRSVWLVARREILERGRSRGFILSVAFTTLIVIGSFVLPAILFGDEQATKVGVVEPAPSALVTTIEETATRFDRTVEVTTYPTAAAADAALADETVAVVVEVPADLSGPGAIRFQEEPDQGIAQILSAATTALRVQEVLGASDVDQAALAAAQQPPTVTAVEPQTEADQARFLVANIGAVLILIGIFSFGFTVLTGVVEEKQSRVVEVVLSTVRARDLLMGKVLGIGVLGVVQLVVFVTAALVAALATDRLVLPTTTPGAIALLGLWFVLGYLLYSTALGFLGALASRMEEASNASTPVTMIAMISYFVAIFAVIDDPDGLVATIATFLPPSAPFVVPLRAAFDAIPPWQIGVSALITVIGIWVLFSIGARVYAGAVLQVGGRMKIRDAWRSAGE